MLFLVIPTFQTYLLLVPPVKFEILVFMYRFPKCQKITAVSGYWLFDALSAPLRGAAVSGYWLLDALSAPLRGAAVSGYWLFDAL